MTAEILTVAEMYAADRYAADHGVASFTLMENAGRAVADEIVKRWQRPRTVVLCGPGSNGGDGYVVARILKSLRWDVRVAHLGSIEALKGDAAQMAKRWDGAIAPLEAGAVEGAELVVDALFGAGLSRPLEGVCIGIVGRLNDLDIPIVVAVDVPSGVHGDLGEPLGDHAVRADLTVTFFRKKAAHILSPARRLCGEIVVADIGIPDSALGAIAPKQFENGPSLWEIPSPKPEGHKYSRGHCIVVSGPAHMTGAARLAARGALRAGAGLVSVASPIDAVTVNAAALTAIMVKPFSGASGLAALMSDKRLNALVIGPGCGVGRATQELVGAALASPAGVVLDADALTSFASDPKAFLLQLREPAVLTPHEGEFERIFPGLLARSSSRIEATRAAALAARCTVLLKGGDTVVAAPDGTAFVNTHAPPTLATAGSGDVLAGIIGGLMAQGLKSQEAAAAAAWLHGEAAFRFGPGLISEDLPEMLPVVFAALKDTRDGRRDPQGAAR
jgi:NAD(P)H-hydrate epimerase